MTCKNIRCAIKIAMLAACSAVFMTPAFGQEKPFKIGEINSYKAYPAFLEPYKKGMELALDEVNAAGGINGRKLELVTRDDNANPGDAVRVTSGRKKFMPVRGEIPSPLDPPTGCHFHPRCPHAMARCKTEVPQLRMLAMGRLTACHLND